MMSNIKNQNLEKWNTLKQINQEDFKKLKQKPYDLTFDEDFCPSKEGTIPKENCI